MSDVTAVPHAKTVALLTKHNAVLAMIDHQPEQYGVVASVRHTGGLAAMAGVIVLASSGIANAADGALNPTSNASQVRLRPTEIVWPSSPSGAIAGSSMQSTVESVVVHGDASKPVLYSIMFRVRPNTKIPAHSHPDDRSCFVVSGLWYFGYGARYSESGLRALPAGSHYTEPANVSHFAATRRTGAVAECTSVGPTATTFTEQADDPRR